MLKTIIWDGRTPLPEDTFPGGGGGETGVPPLFGAPGKPRAVALGIFDGVHLGHRAVISRAAGRELPDGRRATATVFTFTQPPWALPKESACELVTEGQRAAVFESLGVEELIQADFEAIRDFSPQEFVDRVLKDALHACLVCCGFNYHFPVVGGQKLGRLLGTPTINQPLPPHFVRPCFGVYAASVEADGKAVHAVTNVGIRPTVGADGPLAETWIADFHGDLYGRSVPVTLVEFLRPERKFDSVEELQRQILRDGERARRAVLGDPDEGIRAVLFDFDDTLQDRAAAFLGYCDYFLNKYFPVLPAGEKARRRQEMLRRNNGGYVDYPAYFRALFEEWGWKDAPAVEDVYREFQIRFPDTVALLPEAVPVLQELRRRGYRTGVITNGPSLLQNRKLDVSGLRPLLDIAVVSGDEGIHKPDPEIFRRAAARLGVACAGCLYVGDHPVNDVQGSRAAGMRPVYINAFGAGLHPEGAPEIHALSEIFALL